MIGQSRTVDLLGNGFHGPIRIEAVRIYPHNEMLVRVHDGDTERVLTALDAYCPGGDCTCGGANGPGGYDHWGAFLWHKVACEGGR